MSDSAQIAAARWPDVPACYGWLSLDRRGVWRLKDEPVAHPGLMGFLNRHYEADEAGNWLVHNGPQRVYVALDYMPWVLRLEADDGLKTHTDIAAGPVAAVYVDDEGNVLLRTALGPGLLIDRDLPAFLAQCRLADGQPADDAALLAAINGAAGVYWRGLPLQSIRRGDVARSFGFNPEPAD